MNNLNGFCIWDMQEKKMCQSTVNNNPYKEIMQRGRKEKNMLVVTQTVEDFFGKKQFRLDMLENKLYAKISNDITNREGSAIVIENTNSDTIKLSNTAEKIYKEYKEGKNDGCKKFT